MDGRNSSAILCRMPAPGSAAPPASRAFHAEIDAINERRLTPLTLTIMALLGIAAGSGYAQSGRLDPLESNVLGLVLGLVQLPLQRWSSSSRLKANVFGLTIVGWGVTSASLYAEAVFTRRAAMAAAALVAWFGTRVLAGLSLVWRPWDIALILAAGYLISAPVLATVNPTNAFVLMPIWTFVAWLAALLVYRAQREAFAARAVLQQQRDALAAANARLEQLNQEKSDLMAIAAHDLRSPLTGMAMLLTLTAEEAGRAWRAGVDRLRALERSCHDLAGLVSRVLDLQAAEDQLGQLTLRGGDIRPVVSAVVEAHRARAAAKQIALTLDAPGVSCEALHDAEALARAVDNLVSNAIKFSPAGGHVRVRVARNGDAAHVWVSDEGPGIAPEDRDRLFRKFARLRAQPTAGEESSGLGLYITKRLAEGDGAPHPLGDGARGATFVLSLRS